MSRLRHLFRAYAVGHHARRQWFSWKWRLFVSLLLAAALVLVLDYLEGKYFVLSTAYTPVFVLSERLFYWFMVGVLFGLGAMWLAVEGEHWIGLWRAVRRLERQAGREVRNVERAVGLRGTRQTAAKRHRR